MGRSKTARRKVNQTRRGLPKLKVTKTVTATPLKATTKASVLTMVKKLISRNIEKKRIGNRVVSDLTFNNTISSSSECYPIIPQIAEGFAGNERVGNKIKPKSLIVRGQVQWDAETIAGYYAPPSTVRCMILSQKTIKVGSAVSASADVSHLLKDNVGTHVARSYTGTRYDNFAPINTDLFRVHMDKKFKMNWAYTGDIGVAGATAGNTRTASFSVRIKTPEFLTFDDGNGDWVNNFAPFFCFGAVNDDGTATFSVQTPWRVSVLSVLDYEDA